jgi:hypothetical protein
LAKSPSSQTDYPRVVIEGTLLGTDGRELRSGVWEASVYLSADGHVYHFAVIEKGGTVRFKVAGKRTVGEYLRWVDGLFRPGELPDESNAVHYRSARKLRELL